MIKKLALVLICTLFIDCSNQINLLKSKLRSFDDGYTLSYNFDNGSISLKNSLIYENTDELQISVSGLDEMKPIYSEKMLEKNSK